MSSSPAWVKINSGTGGGSAAGPFVRTLLLKDCTVGNDIADHVPVFVAGTAFRVIAVLRKTITSDLTVRINLDGVALITVTVPHATAIDAPVIGSTFISTALGDLGVLSFDVTASDGSTDPAGVATFTLCWE